MKKTIVRIFISVGIAVLIIAMIAYFLGKNEYERVTADISVKEKVEQIQKQNNYVEFNQISPNLINATVAIEDHRFYNHQGIDFIALGRALLGQITGTGNKSGGGSTITQQLAKNLYYLENPATFRKLGEAFVAAELERIYTKKEIITIYVNVINYGDNHMGIKQASRGYFQVEPNDLSIKQASLISGIPQSPSNFQLSNHRDAALIRQKAVLDAMLREGFLSKSEFNNLDL